MTTEETNVAEILRQIAADADEVTGMVVRKAQKAAKKGRNFIVVKVEEEHLACVKYAGSIEAVRVPKPLTSPMQRLIDMGFSLETRGFRDCNGYPYDALVVRW